MTKKPLRNNPIAYIKSLGLLLLGLMPFLFMMRKNRAPVSKEPGKLLVVATTGIIGDILTQIGQDKIQCHVLMQPGVDPHTYEATVEDGDLMYAADLIFYNGLHLEGPMQPIFESMAQGDHKKAYAASDGLAPSDILVDPLFPSGVDPHFWHSVPHFKKAVLYVSRQLQLHDPANADFYKATTEAYIAKLDALHQYIIAAIAKIPPKLRVLVTAHDAFEYFGRTYGIKVQSLQGISTVAEPSIKDREDLKDFIIRHQIRTIFEESSVPSKGIQAVLESCAKEGYIVTSNPYLFSDSLDSIDKPGGTYIGMMRMNVENIVKATKKKS